MEPLIDLIRRGMAAGALLRADPMVAAMTIWAAVHGFVSLEIALWARYARLQRDALYDELLLSALAYRTA